MSQIDENQSLDEIVTIPDLLVPVYGSGGFLCGMAEPDDCQNSYSGETDVGRLGRVCRKDQMAPRSWSVIPA